MLIDDQLEITAPPMMYTTFVLISVAFHVQYTPLSHTSLKGSPCVCVAARFRSSMKSFTIVLILCYCYRLCVRHVPCGTARRSHSRWRRRRRPQSRGRPAGAHLVESASLLRGAFAAEQRAHVADKSVADDAVAETVVVDHQCVRSFVRWIVFMLLIIFVLLIIV